MTALLYVHTAATLAMTGLIWFVQVVHYPLFHFAANGDFSGFAASHQRRTTLVVLPLMALELVTAVLLVLPGSSIDRPLAFIGLLILVTIWLSTLAIQVPLHRRLSVGFDSVVTRRLVRSNWFRTFAWTARSVLALEILRS